MDSQPTGIRRTSYKYNDHDIRILRSDWERFSSQIKNTSKKCRGRGIVYTVGGVTHTTCAWVSINFLRRDLGCTLPIEIWHLGNELSNEVKTKFEGLNVEFRDFYKLGKTHLTGYMLKPLAIINSRFEEVLFLDADNNCIKNPGYLFESEQFREFGCCFWPDFWRTSKSNSIWKIINTKTYHIPEQESGQILINKKKGWKELQLCLYFNKLSEYYYKILLGDKDTFKFAWLALKSKFYMVPFPVGTCGYKQNGYFQGTTMVQHDAEGQILFLHRNLLKWDATQKGEDTWHYIKTFDIQCSKKHIFIGDSFKGGPRLDISGDIKEIEFKEKFGGMEFACLEYLDNWRNSIEYKRFLEYSHFIKVRYKNDFKLVNDINSF